MNPLDFFSVVVLISGRSTTGLTAGALDKPVGKTSLVFNCILTLPTSPGIFFCNASSSVSLVDDVSEFCPACVEEAAKVFGLSPTGEAFGKTIRFCIFFILLVGSTLGFSRTGAL
eukprot:NODE_535_length_6333_cov_1.473051.p5 type:complete len:115 gc:universal NODE_535_length_6333_cov_1.473051:5594-5938(+)